MNLQSSFDILRGLPTEAHANINPGTAQGAALQTGTVVEMTSRQLPAVKVLKMTDDTLTTAPTLTAKDIGKAYVVAGTGGAWSTFAVGDIVEWDGAAWNRIVQNTSGKPPTGTRVIVGVGAAGSSFENHNDKIMTYNGTAWEVTTTPANRAHVNVDGAGSIYYGKYFDYNGTHPNGFWFKPLLQADAPGVATPATSPDTTAAAKMFGLVVRGYDNFDVTFVDKATIVPLHAGMMVKINCADAGSLNPGSYVMASNGAVVAHTSGKRPIGVVVRSNGTNEIVFVTM